MVEPETKIAQVMESIYLNFNNNMAYDFNGAIQAGAAPSDVVNYLAKQTNYNAAGALKAGANPQDLMKYMSNLPFKTQQPVAPDNGMDANQNKIVNDYKSGNINAGDVALQAAGAGAEKANKFMQLTPFGWATSALTGVAKLMQGAGETVAHPVFQAIGSALRDAIGPDQVNALGSKINEILANPTVQKLAAQYSDTKSTGDLNALNQIFGLTGTLGVGKAAVEGLPEAVKGIPDATNTAKEAISNSPIVSKLADKVNPTPTPTEVTGQITQAKPEEISSNQRALGGLDTSNVKTYSDLSSAADKQIKANSKAVDEALSKDTTPHKTNELTQRTPGGKFGINYVKQALTDLNELYTKTKDIAAKENIVNLQSKLQNEGLTAKEINDISREYGSQKVAYKVNGELKDSPLAQGYENVRSGLKTTARGLIPGNEAQTLDKNTTDLIRLKESADSMATKVQQLENKMQKAGLLQKVGKVAGGAVDMVSGGLIKGFVKKILGVGLEEGTKLDPIQIQENLAKNLKLLDRLNSMTPKEAVSEIKAQGIKLGDVKSPK
jgi:hypothetical protein